MFSPAWGVRHLLDLIICTHRNTLRLHTLRLHGQPYSCLTPPPPPSRVARLDLTQLNPVCLCPCKQLLYVQLNIFHTKFLCGVCINANTTSCLAGMLLFDLTYTSSEQSEWRCYKILKLEFLFREHLNSVLLIVGFCFGIG